MRTQVLIQKSLVFLFTIALLLTLGVLGNLSYGASDTPHIYWTDWETGKIQRANLDGSNVKDIHTTGLFSGPISIALDIDAGKMYWTEIGLPSIIRRANLDGSNIEDLIEMSLFDPPINIALDIDAGKMYWTVSGFSMGIQRANLDGSNIEELIEMDLFSGSSLDGIALDVAAGKMYWTDIGLGKIQRANLDGSNVEDLVTGVQGVKNPEDIALDITNRKMYWTDADADKIRRANLDGSNVQDLITTGLDNPIGIALDVDGGKMYWTHGEWDEDTEVRTNGKIQRANLNGSNVQDLVTTGVDNPISIALSIPPQRTPVVTKADDPGDKRSKAMPLPLGTSYTEKIDPGNDVDYFSVKVNGTGQLKLYTTGDLNTVGELQNSSGARLVKNDNSGSGVNFRIEHDVDPGTYYLKITSSGTKTGNYTVYARFTPAVSVEGTSPYLSIYWIDEGTDKIYWANLDGTNIQDIVTDKYLKGIALDVAGEKMYWADSSKIQRANLDGSNVEGIAIGGYPDGIALDITGGKIYWTDWIGEKIQRANLDGSNVQDLVTTGLDSPWDIALDVPGGKMYWVNRFGGKGIQRGNLDGSNVQDLVTDVNPTGIALDVESGKIYWTDWLDDKIQRANLDGSNIQDLVTTGLKDPSGIALDVLGGKMYWADGETGKIQCANLDGSNVQTIVIGLQEPSYIALGPTSPGVWDRDVNGDGKVTHLDIIEVGKNYGKTVTGGANPRADVNEDGKVDINDLVLVARAVDAAAAAPILAGQLPDIPFTAQDLEQWIREAKHQNLSARGIAVLEHLLAALTRSEMPVKETALLPNYPNPFNPETWIPYQLAASADVTLHIYSADGKLIRTLALGQKTAGIYQHRSRAAYWDGKNAVGESVASGVYFYTLTAGEFTATRKMLIRK